MAGRRHIYADNAATTCMSPRAIETMCRYLSCQYGNASQPYSFAREPKKALKEARRIIADCINANPDEIYFTSGGTESDNWALANAWQRNIVTTQIEHHAILNTCADIENRGGNVSYLPPMPIGIIEIDILEKSISPHSFVSVMTANNEIGTIEPISEYASLVHGFNTVFHTDAVQAVGHIEINVKEWGVDMLSASGHKFNGPKGIGFLYVRSGIDLYPLIHGGAQENKKRAGTENVGAIMAMAVALRENMENLQRNQKHLYLLEEILLDGLHKTGINFIRNGYNQLPGLLSLSFEGKNGEAILHRLDLLGISVSTGSACDSKSTQISHVLRAIQLPTEYAKGTIRISFGKNNTEEDARTIANALIRVLSS